MQLRIDPRLHFCPIRSELLDVLAKATRDYATAVQSLGDISQRRSQLEYREMVDGVKVNREAMHNARTALTDHQQKHGC